MSGPLEPRAGRESWGLSIVWDVGGNGPAVDLARARARARARVARFRAGFVPCWVEMTAFTVDAHCADTL